jgi:transcriptional regulator of heat shock response
MYNVTKNHLKHEDGNVKSILESIVENVFRIVMPKPIQQVIKDLQVMMLSKRKVMVCA